MRIIVAGATGSLGRHICTLATGRNHEIIPLARSLGVDLTTGSDLGTQLIGADAVIDVTSVATKKAAEAQAFFGSVTDTLLRAEAAAGVGHHVALSIVGIDDLPIGHYAGKIVQEKLISDGDVPWSILRATQFHEFAEQALGFMSFGPFSVIPRMASQTVAAVEVAEHLLDITEAGPSGRMPDLAGPEANQIVDLARRIASARGLARRVIPGPAGKAMRSGALRPRSAGSTGALTFEEWLAR